MTDPRTRPPWRATCFGGPWDGRELEFRRLRAVLGPGGQVMCWVPDGEERFPVLADGSYAMTELGTLFWVSKRRMRSLEEGAPCD